MAKARMQSARTKRSAGLPAESTSGARALADLDTQLMLQARGGNSEAANTLIRRNAPRITRYIARLIGARRPVEDLTQDVFVQALTHADRYAPTAKVSTWLYRIATNLALNYLKQPHVKRESAEPPSGAREPADRTAPPPDRQLTLDELKSQVGQAIAGLPVNQRVALTLFEYEECSYEQIATVMDVTVEAVRSLLLRARATLRRSLNGVL